MRLGLWWTRILGAAFVAAWLGFLCWKAGAGETQDGSADALIGSLISSPDAAASFVIPCGESQTNRSTAEELIALGPPALPAVERTLDLIEAQDRRSVEVPNARLILDAYVRIKGRPGYPRLMKMIDDATMPSLQLALDDSVALLLGLTSAVSFRPGKTALRTNSISSCRSLAPRDSLDRLIIAWEANSRSGVEASLSPSAREELSQLLAGKTWGDFRAEFWHAPNDRGVTLGYRFPPAPSLEHTVPREIPTTFETGAGRDCGSIGLKFAGVPLIAGASDPKRYLVDGPDLAALFRLISSCAADTAQEP
jgi:hypothetical protein